jgi:hypothetical protein
MISWEEFDNELNKVNTFRQIRLAYALLYRTHPSNSIVYKIRIGKSYASTFSYNKNEKLEWAISFTVEEIVGRVSKNVKGKKIYIPENIVYALPATEKQFTGNLPSGTYIKLDKDMVVGAYWENVDFNRVDLDLSLISSSGKFGWDANFRGYYDENSTILFSGDMTDATHGATELFYVAKQLDSNYVMYVNWFNKYDGIKEVPIKIIVAYKDRNEFIKSHVIDPNHAICVVKSNIAEQQKVLGLVVSTPTENRFYFSECYLGNSITSVGNEYGEQTKNYLFNFYTKMLSLNEVLELAGAILVKERKDAEIDLSVETVEKDTIINLLK